MKLLHIDSSILGSHSKSRQLTAAIVVKFRQEHPQIEIVYRDLVATPPPHMTLASLPGDHPLSARAGPLDEVAQRVREESQRLLDEFMAADVVVLGAPMYNWSIPTQLKSWIDIIVVPGKTFRYGPQGRRKGWSATSASSWQSRAVCFTHPAQPRCPLSMLKPTCARCCLSWE